MREKYDMKDPLWLKYNETEDIDLRTPLTYRCSFLFLHLYCNSVLQEAEFLFKNIRIISEFIEDGITVVQPDDTALVADPEPSLKMLYWMPILLYRANRKCSFTPFDLKSE